MLLTMKNRTLVSIEHEKDRQLLDLRPCGYMTKQKIKESKKIFTQPLEDYQLKSKHLYSFKLRF